MDNAKNENEDFPLVNFVDDAKWTDTNTPQAGNLLKARFFILKEEVEDSWLVLLEYNYKRL